MATLEIVNSGISLTVKMIADATEILGCREAILQLRYPRRLIPLA